MQPDYQLIYEKLFNHYGPQSWWPADTPFEMMIGSILVQNTNWRNVEKALVKLRPYLDPESIDFLPIEELAQLIRSSGFFNIKAKRIKAFIAWFKKYNFDIDRIKRKEKRELRNELLLINGIGMETADVMLLYAFDKPVFVVDAYARRIFYRLGHDMPASYDGFGKLVEKELPGDLVIFNESHALLVEHAKQLCRAKPICVECPLLSICDQRIE
ncbi:endonuclease [Virgibacillus profundi]|uniref:Endonuclease n=1 Tax=Virgibacillus profundi TaxID=2024555 RepID=A0A2A2IKB9_9BACI|nr:endonuclease III domain-containing protein [Virgibacillus profundi]PAV31610.1 endonuclease [Virgibacillus profundi]PXY55796.1 endonuclease III domain-containing protein [Virgibacillus profundi]